MENNVQTPYSQIIGFRAVWRNTSTPGIQVKAVNAFRRSTCPRYGIIAYVEDISFTSLYAGHCDWIARDIAARERANQERKARNERTKRAA